MMAGQPPDQSFMYSTAFVRTDNLEVLRGALADIAEDDFDVWMVTRDELRLHALEEAERFLPRPWRVTLMIGFLFGAAIILAREQGARLQRRRYDVAILTAAGARARWVQMFHIAETLTVTVLTGTLALFAARWLVVGGLGIYLPWDQARAPLLQALGLMLLLVTWGAIRTKRTLERVPVSRLLASEAGRA
jgi:predicted lysophospholipase L1 biosynthesis ABC-type transport system permease subunit